MKKQWTKKLTALLCSVLMLCSLCAVGVSADNGLEIWEGADTIYLPYGTEFYPSCSHMPEGVLEEDIVWTFGDESLVKHVEDSEYYQAIAVGETTLTATTADGAYTDTVAIIVQPAIPMTSDTVKVHINYAYMARTFEYVASQTGYYLLDMIMPENSYGYVQIFDADLNTLAQLMPGEETYFEAGETYYLLVVGLPMNGVSTTLDMSLTYIGEEAEAANSLMFTEDEITISVYDVVGFPSYTFEPGGTTEDDSVTFSTEEGSILMVDNTSGVMYASDIGTATLTVTADYYGWTDTVTVHVVDDMRVLTADAALPMSVGRNDQLAVFFTAPETKAYTFYSVIETEEDDPWCYVYDAQTGEQIDYSDDDGEDYNFKVTIELTEGQVVMLVIGGYNFENNFRLEVGDLVAATGVEIYLSYAVSQTDDVAYVYSGQWIYPDVRFLGGPTAAHEEYDVSTQSDTAQPDEYGGYQLQAGQSMTCTVTTENGLTDTLTIVAIDAILGDLTVDGKVSITDAVLLFQYINGTTDADAALLGAMEYTGDNNVSITDAVALFQYVNGQ